MFVTKKKYLTAYDYGAGGCWQYFIAETPSQIKSKYPQLTVFEDEPDWFSDEKRRPVINRTYDINDEPDEFLSALMKE